MSALDGDLRCAYHPHRLELAIRRAVGDAGDNEVLKFPRRYERLVSNF
jgi:hypothetical protein